MTKYRFSSSLHALLSALSVTLGMLFALSFPLRAQEPARVPRIGYVRVVGVPSPPGPNVEAFRRGLQDLGYVEGKNILIEFRYAEGKRDRIPSIVAELVQLPVNAIISGDSSTIRIAKEATRTIPIVMVINQDPVATGLVNSLAQPGGNVTGISRLTRELSAKRLELLAETIPGVRRVGILWDGGAESAKMSFNEYQRTVHDMRIQLHSTEVRGPVPDLDVAFRTLTKERVNAVITIGNALLNRNRKQIAQYAIKHRLPSMFESEMWTDAGGLISYSTNDAESYRRAAWYVDKILKDSKPSDLPVEQPTQFELVINLRTAQQIGLTIPPALLARANRVIR